MATIMKNPKQSSPSSRSLSLSSQPEATPPTSFTTVRDAGDPILSRIVIVIRGGKDVLATPR
jgi:hypothetical protein